jgi:hypothetical protein
MLIVPIPDPCSATSFQTHEKYLYGIPHDISIDLASSTSLPQEFLNFILNSKFSF